MGAWFRRHFLLAAGAATVAVLGGCKIVSIADQETELADAFNATRFAEGIWETRVLPHFAKEAKPLPEVISAVGADFAAAGAGFGYRAAAEGAPWNFVVTATGTVKEKNTKSRAGTLSVELAGGGIVPLQIGPVLKGNSVRDSLPFVSFKEFTTSSSLPMSARRSTLSRSRPWTQRCRVSR